MADTTTSVTRPATWLITFLWIVFLVIPVFYALHHTIGWTYSEMGYGVAYVILQFFQGVGRAILYFMDTQ